MLNIPKEYTSFQIRALRKAKKMGYKHPIDTLVGGVTVNISSLLEGEEKKILKKREENGTQRHVAMLFFEDCMNKNLTIEEIKIEAEKFFKEYWKDDGLEIVKIIKKAEKIEYN